MKKKKEQIEQVVVTKKQPKYEKLYEALSEEDKIEYDTSIAEFNYYRALQYGSFVACAGLALFYGKEVLGPDFYDSGISITENIVVAIATSVEHFYSNFASCLIKLSPIAIGSYLATTWELKSAVSKEKANYILYKSKQDKIKKSFIESIALKSAKKKAQKRQAEVQEMPEFVESQDINKYDSAIQESVATQANEDNSLNKN